MTTSSYANFLQHLDFQDCDNVNGAGTVCEQKTSQFFVSHLIFEAGGGAGHTLIYSYVNSKVPHSWGRKLPFFLTYCNYNGALNSCQGEASVPNSPYF
jgi:hypothetical protein